MIREIKENSGSKEGKALEAEEAMMITLVTSASLDHWATWTARREQAKQKLP